MENIPMKLLDTPDCAICEKSDCTRDCLSFPYGKSVKVCPACKSHSIVNNEEIYKFCPECGQAIDQETDQEEPIHLNPKSIVIWDGNWIARRLFVGYNISEEDLKEIERRYCNGK